MLYIVPTRGRPQNARELIEAWEATGAYANLTFVVDEDDASVDEYVAIVSERCAVNVDVYTLPPYDDGGGMVAPLNGFIQRQRNNLDHHEFIGFMGDDHRPRTHRWDSRLAEAMIAHNAWIGYADDRVQGRALPTAVLMRVDIVKALGYMAPPCLQHLYVDNYWRDLGNALGGLHYEPSVIIEHVHPITGKVDWDEGYRRMNDGAIYAQDFNAYAEFKQRGGIEADAVKIREL